jgi:hypothetical protein
MTQEEIIELARQAARHNTILDQDDVVEGDLVMLYFDELEAFAKLVAAKEREACADLCDKLADEDDSFYAEFSRAEDCAEAIRARS